MVLDLVEGKFYTILGPTNRRIVRGNLDGTGLEDVVPLNGTLQLYGLAVDPIGRQIYYSANNLLYRVGYDGQEIEEIEGLFYARGLTVDYVNRQLYMTRDYQNPSILRANINDLVPETLIWNSIPNPTSFLPIPEIGAYLYREKESVIGTGTLKRAKLDWSDPVELFSIPYLSSYSFEPSSQKLYWSAVMPDRVGRCNLDGTEQELLIENPIRTPRGVQVDPVARRFFWADAFDQRICSASYDGTDRLCFAAKATELALDLTQQKVYWVAGYFNGLGVEAGEDEVVNPDPPVPYVQRSNFDGTNQETIFEVQYPTGQTYGITVDTLAGKVYWTRGTRIERANLDGSELEEFVSVPDFISSPRGLAVDSEHGKLYWADRSAVDPRNPHSQGGVVRANLDGTECEFVLSTVGKLRPKSIVLESRTGQLYYTVVDQNDGTEVRKTDVRGNEPELIHSSPDLIRGLAFDAIESRFFWSVTTDQFERIDTSNGDGTGVHTLLQEQFGHVGVFVEPISESLFLAETEHDPDRILRTTLDGANMETVVTEPSTNNTSNFSFAVDSGGQHLYWTRVDVLKRSNLDGSDITLIEGEFGNNLMVDDRSDKIYWTSEDYEIKRANLDGSDVQKMLIDFGFFGFTLNTTPHLKFSGPKNCSVDARQPIAANDPTIRLGLSSIDLTFSSELVVGDLLDFEVIETGGDGVAPAVQAVEVVGLAVVRVTLVEPIEPGAWTCFYHVNSGTKSCVGYLPGDVDGDGTSSPVDVLRLLDSLNGVVSPPYEIWQTDINRSGAAEPSDILRLIDLLNGAGAFEVWNGRTIGACP